MKKRGIVAVIALLLIGLDQLVKNYVVQQIPLGEVRSWIPNLVSLTYLQNRGAAFSMLQDQQWLFAVITLVVMVGAIWYLHKHMVSFWTDFDNRGRSWQLYRQNESRFCGGYVSPRLYQLCDFQCC